MKKLLNFILVNREEVKNKWWHRLFIVLLLASAIILFVSVFFSTVNDNNHVWLTYHPVAFSLEPNYQQANGKELSCDYDISAFIHGEGLKCDGVILSEADSKRYTALYSLAEKNLDKHYGFDKYFDTSACRASAPADKISDCEFDIVMKGSKAEQEDPSYAQYQIDLKNLAHIKVARDVNFLIMFKDIALWLIIPIIILFLWVILWGSIVYRSILYIIYGKQN